VNRVQAAAERNGLALVTLGAVLFATGSVMIASTDVSGPVLAFWRAWIGTCVLAVVFALYGRSTGRWPDADGWRWAIRAGVVFAAHQLCNMVAIKRTSVVDVTLIQVLTPVVVAVLAARVFHEHPGVRFRLWSLVAVAGAVVVVLGGAGGPEGEPLGMCLAVGNVCCYSVYFVLSKQSRAAIDVVPFLFGVILTSALVLTAFVGLTGESVGRISHGDLLAAGGVAVLPGIIGHFVTTWPLRWVPANIPPLLQLCMPFVAGGLAWVVLDQGITPWHVLGGAFTIVGVAGAIRSPAGRRMIAREEAVLVTGAT
jgi:drug/metabolite transporter (DMT)-like permease